jgi:hypothetical protein
MTRPRDAVTYAEEHPPPGLVQELQTELGWSRAKALAGYREARRFVDVCAADPQFSGVPSELVDKVWHRWILHTSHYADYCAQRGGYVHHHPVDKPSGAGVALYAETRERIRQRFGSVTPRWWAASARCQRCFGNRVAD